MNCATCKGEGKVITRMEAIHAPPAPMVMIKVYGTCPGCEGTGKVPDDEVAPTREPPK